MTEAATLTAQATTTLSDDHTTAAIVTPLTVAMSTTYANTINITEASKNAATNTGPISYVVGILAVFLLLIGTSMVVMLILYVRREKQRNSEANSVSDH